MSEKIKLTILLGGLYTGGAERVAVSLANYIVNNTGNTEVTFVLFNENKSLYDINDKIKVVELLSNKSNSLFNYFTRKKKLKDFFCVEEPDIILTFFEKMTLYARSTKNKKSVLISSDRGNINYRVFFRRIVCRYMAKKCDGFIFQTNDAKKCYSKKVQKHSIVIPNAVSTYSEMSKKKNNIVSAMGRLTYQKGFDTLVRAFSVFCKDNNNYSLNIYGDGEDKELLQNLINSLNVSEHVKLMGNKKDAINEISKSKIFVLSSRYEGMPNALLEAMASGVASISTDCPFGPNEIIEDGVNGLLVNVDNINELANKMHILANNESLRKTMETNALKIRESHNPNKIFSDYYEYMKKVLLKKRNKKSFSLRLFEYLRDKKLLNILSDKSFLKLSYRVRTGEKLDLKNPQSFNEKLQWLKINDHNSEYTNLVDKYEVKGYISKKIGKEYVIPTHGVYEEFDDINFDDLPNSFVIKCTHDSGGIYICKDKSKFKVDEAREFINKRVNKNYYIFNREWPYKNIKPRIIVEKFMADGKNNELVDYKVMCFNGEPKMIFTCTDRFSDGLKVTFFDLNWKKLPFERHYPASKKRIEKPKNLKKMVDLSKELSKEMRFVRIDWYEINGKLYFGEFTFYPGSGMEEFNPIEWDYKLGEMLDLKK